MNELERLQNELEETKRIAKAYYLRLQQREEGNGCDLCRAYDRIAELTRERDYYQAQAIKWADVVQRQGLSYAEEVSLDEFEQRFAAG